jgi:diadenosine tetraphosphate (Ap4A) HIT family hydrolase
MAHELKFPSASFDGFWCSALIQHLSISEISRLISSVSRTAKPLAAAYFSFPLLKEETIDTQGRAVFAYTNSQIDGLLIEAGFKIVSSRIREYDEKEHKTNSGPWAIIFARAAAPLETIEHNECVFCGNDVLKSNFDAALPIVASIAAYGHGLLIVPDVAPVGLGHLLVIPELHLHAMTSIPPDEARHLVRAMKSIEEFHEEKYDAGTLFFEHGGTTSDRGAGCIDHAHLHCVPSSLAEFKFIAELAEQMGAKCLHETIVDSEMDQPYVYLKYKNQEHYLSADTLPRQFGRMAISKFRSSEESLPFKWYLAVETNLSRKLFLNTLEDVSNSMELQLCLANLTDEVSSDAGNQ